MENLRVEIIKRMNEGAKRLTGREISQAAQDEIMDMSSTELLEMYEGSVWQRLLALPVSTLLDIKEQCNVRAKRLSNEH
jgi:hypothetical protein